MNFPTTIKNPIPYQRSRYAGLSGPLRNRHGLTIMLNVAVVSFVIALLHASSPSAVGGGVVPIVVDAVNGCSNWSISHVLQKTLERGHPSIANLNSPAPVISPCIIPRIATAVLHSDPNIVDGMSHQYSLSPMYSPSLSCGLLPKASTAGCPSAFQGATKQHFVLSALTPTQPKRLVMLVHAEK